jgi:hypothetical protein
LTTVEPIAGSENGPVDDSGGACGRKITLSGRVKEFEYSVKWKY